MIDDIGLNRTIMQEYVENVGIRCDTATSGKEAMDMLRKAQESKDMYDIVLIDSHMPEMNGHALARVIKSDIALKDTLLVMTTPNGQRGEAKAMEALGFSGYLVKPFHSHVLTDVIALLLSKKREGRQLPLVTRHTVSHSIPMEKTIRENISFGARILVAEDNHINQMMVTQMLELMDCKVYIAGSGKEAVEMVKQFDYDLMLMDCMMPEMSGYEATEIIRKLEGEKRNLTIIALTANALSGDKKKCLAVGMSDYLSKPVKKVELHAMLAKWLKPTVPKSEEINNTVQQESDDKTAICLANVMDQQIWDRFLGLIGTQADGVLHKHCEIAQGYMLTIQASLGAKDFKAMADAAHPLKSSSQQIGALEVAKLAAHIEEICQSSSPNPFVLRDLMRQLEQCQQRVKQVIGQTFIVSKTA